VGCCGLFVRGLLLWVVMVGLSEGCYCGLLWLVCQRVVIVGCYSWFVIVGCYGWFVIVGCYSGLLWLVC